MLFIPKRRRKQDIQTLPHLDISLHQKRQICALSTCTLRIQLYKWNMRGDVAKLNSSLFFLCVVIFNKKTKSLQDWWRQPGFLLSSFTWILYHFFFDPSFMDAFFSSFKTTFFLLLLLLLRFVCEVTVYDACISFLCLRSSSIYKNHNIYIILALI